jgi:prepilin-type N-terminal cleavage/methylation domain-containing protein
MITRAGFQQNATPCPGIAIRNDRQTGVTMVELLVALCILAVISVLIFGLMSKLRRSYTTQRVASDVQESTRSAIDYICQDLRMAGYDPLNKADARIEAMTATSLRVTSDRNGDGEIEDANRERVSFVYDAPNRRLQQILYEGTASSTTEILISNVSGTAFSYFDQNGNVTADPDEVRTLEVLLTVEQKAGLDGPVQRTYATRVKCRNIGL